MGTQDSPTLSRVLKTTSNRNCSDSTSEERGINMAVGNGIVSLNDVRKRGNFPRRVKIKNFEFKFRNKSLSSYCSIYI